MRENAGPRKGNRRLEDSTATVNVRGVSVPLDRDAALAVLIDADITVEQLAFRLEALAAMCDDCVELAKRIGVQDDYWADLMDECDRRKA